MSKDKELRIGLALHKIAMVLSDEEFEKVKDYLKEIETAVLEDKGDPDND